MFDIKARRVVEALRSGVPSRAVGEYFSESRPELMRRLSSAIDSVRDGGKSCGMVISGKYGEGKTHLLNCLFTMAHQNNMVVSFVSLSKETPMDKLPVIYKKIINETYLPGREQPGFMHELDKLTPNSPVASEMLLYATRELETDKLYHLMRAYLNTEDEEEKFVLRADLEGDFIANPMLKNIVKRIFNQSVKYNVNFSKTRHCGDYFAFMSHLFRQLGYDGWVILIDETELMGRLGKKARLNAYKNIYDFLEPAGNIESVFSVFALSSSYAEEVIDGKNEAENLFEYYPKELYPDENMKIEKALTALNRATQLAPLTKDEIVETILRVKDFHAKAYGWEPAVSTEDMIKVTLNGGYLLRTKIRAAIEYLDQIYQYGVPGQSSIGEVSTGNYEEENHEEENHST